MTGDDTKKPRLADIVRQKLHEKRVVVRALAVELGIPDATVRGWLRNNVFPKDLWDGLAQYLGLPKDKSELESAYDFHWAGHRGARVLSGKRDYTATVKAIAQANTSITLEDLQFLIRIQEQLPEPLSSTMVTELIKNRRRSH